MNICLFKPEEIDSPLDLRDERAVHLIKILHKQEGNTFSAGITGGMAGTATITSIEKHKETAPNGKEYEAGSLTFTFSPETDGKQLNPLIMIIGFPRPIQLKRLLRDMAGLGVLEVHLTGTELSEKSYLESDMATTDSGNQMLYEGTVQAASTHIPLLVRHNSVKECIEYIKNNTKESKPKLLALDNVNAKCGLTGYLNENPLTDDEKKPLLTVAAIGSERGWTLKERELLEQNGFIRLSMGSRVLRTETAATVAASLILSSMQILD